MKRGVDCNIGRYKRLTFTLTYDILKLSMGKTKSKTERKVRKMEAVLKMIVEGVMWVVGVFSVGFVVAIVEDILKDNPKYRAEHRKKVEEWLHGIRKEYPRYVLIFSILCASIPCAFAEDNPSDQFAVGGGRVLTQAEVQYNEQHGIYAVNDARSKPQTADQIAEQRFADANMGRDAKGNAVVIAPATGHRQIISSRMALTPDGKVEGIPTNTELEEHKKAVADARQRNLDNARKAGLIFEEIGEKENGKKAEKDLIDASESTLQEQEKKIEQWEKDKKNETKKYETPKVLISLEANR